MRRKIDFETLSCKYFANCSSVNQYLNEIRKYTKMTPEEEEKLFTQPPMPYGFMPPKAPPHVQVHGTINNYLEGTKVTAFISQIAMFVQIYTKKILDRTFFIMVFLKFDQY